MLRHIRAKSGLALAERFQQILDEKLQTASPSLIDADPHLRKLAEKYKHKEFDAVHQKLLMFAKSEHLVRGKEARELADTVTNPPWTGSETQAQAVMRMVMDSKPKPLKVSKPAHKASAAREAVFEFQVDKTLTDEERERKQFRAQYKERLLGPSMLLDATLPLVSIGLIGTVADARISEAIDKATGKFKTAEMENVRGKPIQRETLANCTDSNFFMNHVLSSQECLPPWIEAQQGIDTRIARFRAELERKWLKLLMRDALASYAQAKARLANADRQEYVGEFRKAHGAYLQVSIDSINKLIRDYNLQSPSTALHKWKLSGDAEVDAAFERATQLSPAMYTSLAPKAAPAAPAKSGFFSFFRT